MLFAYIFAEYKAFSKCPFTHTLLTYATYAFLHRVGDTCGILNYILQLIVFAERRRWINS